MTDRPVDWPTRDFVAHAAEATPDAPAVVAADGRTWTYRAFDALVGHLAAQLEDGLAADDRRVGTVLPTRAGTAAILHAILRLGRTAVPLVPSVTDETATRRFERAEVGMVVCESTTEATARAAVDGPVRSLDRPAAGDVVALTSDAPSRTVTSAALDRDDEAIVAFTSGTTGTPAGVTLTLGNLVASATASAFRLGLRPDERWLCCLPMAHLGGLSPVVRSACYGTTLVVQRDFDAARTADRLASEDITGVSLVPTQLRRLLDRGDSPLPALRCVLLGGAPATEDLLSDALAADIPIHPTYGTTETASQIATARPPTVRERPGTVGQPLPFTTVTVVNEEGAIVDRGDPGELVVDGPTVSPGYLDAARTDAAFGPHGLHTGDFGYRDADGYLFVLGRLDDAILTGGATVQPARVAATLREHPAVRDAAVVGLPDDEWGERVAALVVVDEPVEDLRSFCRDRLGAPAVPKTIERVAALPRTPSGTVDREAVRDRLQSG